MATQLDRDVIERVKSRLLAWLDEAAEQARTSGRALALAAYYVMHRDRLNRARSVFRAASVADQERVMREAQLAYLRRESAFSDAASPSALLREWANVLVEAAEKVDRDNGDAQLYAAVVAGETAEDREWAEASRRIAGQRWEES
jgi:hypothetical protein